MSPARPWFIHTHLTHVHLLRGEANVRTMPGPLYYSTQSNWRLHIAWQTSYVWCYGICEQYRDLTRWFKSHYFMPVLKIWILYVTPTGCLSNFLIFKTSVKGPYAVWYSYFLLLKFHKFITTYSPTSLAFIGPQYSLTHINVCIKSHIFAYRFYLCSTVQF
jgi:hypothetical protein